jgi:WD40 repeat protein
MKMGGQKRTTPVRKFAYAETSDAISKLLEGHSYSVNSVAFLPDGKCIVSSSYDKTIHLWDAETSDAISNPLQGHSHSVNSVAFSPDWKHIMSGLYDNTIRMWDAGIDVRARLGLKPRAWAGLQRAWA